MNLVLKYEYFRGEYKLSESLEHTQILLERVIGVWSAKFSFEKLSKVSGSILVYETM